jgi:hypothetical protein
MPKSKSDAKKQQLVGGAGLLASIWIGLLKQVEKIGGLPEELHALATPAGERKLQMMAEIACGLRCLCCGLWKLPQHHCADPEKFGNSNDPGCHICGQFDSEDCTCSPG